MIRVTVELIPHGVEDHPRRRVLGKMEIANDGSGTEEIGNYKGTLHAEYTSPAGRPGKLFGFRRQRQSVWTLIGAFLKKWGHAK